MQGVSAAEVDRNTFWKLIKKSRGSVGGGINAIRTVNENVVHKTDEILGAFKGHFTGVCTTCMSYDAKHFTYTTANKHREKVVKTLRNFIHL